ncbi:xylulokinase [Enterococcus faecium]|uniref:xylulokinase n=1 Tax=Enterococcus faecium TaxID=1352 RepID=UPI001E5125AB|nr:xylulokinase [Enterococcus faecium]MCD5100548.1 xylulokinase [Enterococcus faecium]MCD5218195.1 xylulokinase [Enterococcus faecium]
MSYVLGLDLGTGSLKGLLMTKEGSIITTKSADYPLVIPQPGYSEQDPAEWLKATEQVIQEIIEEVPDAASSIKGISFSGQMHSLVLLDDENNVLRNAILWNDVRTTQQCHEITETLKEDLIKITKNRALEGFTLPKLLWVKENEPNNWQQTARFLLPKDYLGYWLTGNQQMEYSDAAGTLLLDVESKQWSNKILDAFSIEKRICPPLVYSTDCIGTVRDELLERLGLQGEIVVFAGGADNACAAVGAGIVKDGLALASIGTSGVFLSFEETGDKEYEGDLHYFNHAAKDAYYSMGVTLAAGHSLTWYRNTFAKNETYEELLKSVASVPVGSEGLYFTPYIVGERTPHVDSQVRGTFIGMDTSHTRDHFTRSVLEGITFSLKDSQVLMEEKAGKTFKKIVSVGGGSKNRDWLQMQADVFDATIVTLETEQGPAMGAAMIAAVGVDWYANLKECAEKVVIYKEEIHSIPENVEKYEAHHKKYQQIYPATKSFFYDN